MAEPTPPKSPTQGETIMAASLHEEADDQDGQQCAQQLPEPQEPECMFVQPCTTGSTLRKAISHIFGRNKLCTKAIPRHIWVHYCRKHYQRTRYRNVHDYALLQIDLVLQQINRVEAWSNDNNKYDRRGDGELRHWTLQARKREAKRLLDTESRKRRFHEDDDNDDTGDTGTAIPDWLQPALNQTYSTPRMLEIVQDIKDRMTSVPAEINQIPDIEILPEIITDGNEVRPKPATRRSSTTGGHRHTKSEMFRAPMGYGNNPRFDTPKRMRSGVSSFSYSSMPLAHRPGPVVDMSQSYPYGMRTDTGFATIAEAQQDHGYWQGSTAYGSNSVLPQPVPQLPSRTQDSVNMQQYTPQGRPSMHTRSLSEAPAMRSTAYPPADFRFHGTQVNAYGGQQQQTQDMFPGMSMSPQSHYSYHSPPATSLYGMTPRPDSQDQVYNTTTNNNFYRQQQDWQVSRGQHSRVHSTPSIHEHQGSIPGGPPAMTAVSGPHGLRSMHHLGGQQMYSTGQHGYGDYQQGRF